MKPRGILNFIEFALSEVEDCPGRVFLTSFEIDSIEFEKKHAYHKARSLVAVKKRVVSDNPGGVQRGQIDQARGSVCKVL
jgi:hypothetical protein